jgi:hypothetical protein
MARPIPCETVLEEVEAERDVLRLVCEAIYAEVGAGGDLDYHLREKGYAEMLRAALGKVEGSNGA